MWQAMSQPLNNMQFLPFQSLMLCGVIDQWQAWHEASTSSREVPRSSLTIVSQLLAWSVGYRSQSLRLVPGGKEKPWSPRQWLWHWNSVRSSRPNTFTHDMSCNHHGNMRWVLLSMFYKWGHRGSRDVKVVQLKFNLKFVFAKPGFLSAIPITASELRDE